jgi:uncharacterized protein YlxW (UPF0749 family)
MRLRTATAILAVALLAVFTVRNWPAFTAPTALDLVVTTVQAPLGLVMLALLGIVTLVFAVSMAMWQGAILMDSRRHAKELQQQRTLADQAEASRFSELRAALHEEMQQLAARVTQVHDTMRAELRDSTESLSSMIGEMDDRLRRRDDA